MKSVLCVYWVQYYWAQLYCTDTVSQYKKNKKISVTLSLLSFHQRIFTIYNSCDQHHVCPVWRNMWIDSVSVLWFLFLPPAVVSVGSVGFSHLVQLMLLLDNVALLHKSCQQFLGKFFIHVCASVFVVPALCDHPLHGEEATSVVRKRDGHLEIEQSTIQLLCWCFNGTLSTTTSSDLPHH